MSSPGFHLTWLSGSQVPSRHNQSSEAKDKLFPLAHLLLSRRKPKNSPPITFQDSIRTILAAREAGRVRTCYFCPPKKALPARKIQWGWLVSRQLTVSATTLCWSLYLAIDVAVDIVEDIN